MATRRVKASPTAHKATPKPTIKIPVPPAPNFAVVEMNSSLDGGMPPFETGVWSTEDGKPQFGYKLSYGEDGLMLESGSPYERTSCKHSFSSDGEIYLTDSEITREMALRHLDALEAVVAAARKILTK